MRTRSSKPSLHWLATASLLYACSGGTEGGADDSRDDDDKAALGLDGSVRNMDGSLRGDGSRPPPPPPRDQDAIVPAVESKQLRTECELRWPLAYSTNDYYEPSEGTFSVNELEGAPDNGAYLIGTFTHRLDFGADKLTSDALYTGFVHKVDASCKPVKTFAITPTNATDNSMPGGMAVDKDGNVYVASISNVYEVVPQVGAQISATELLLDKYTPSGERAFRTRLVAKGAGAWISDLEVDAQGRVILTGAVPSFGDVGGGPLIEFGVPIHSFAATYDAQGKFVAQQLGQNFGYMAANEDTVGILNNRGGYRNFFEFFFSLGSPRPVQSLLEGFATGDLSKRWSRVLTSVDSSWPWSVTALPGGAFAVAVEASGVGNNLLRSTTEIVRVSSTGEELERTVLLDREVNDSAFYGTGFVNPMIRGTSQGGLLLAGAYSSKSLTFAGTELKPPRETSTTQTTWLLDGGGIGEASYESYPFLMELDNDDKVLWAETLDWGGKQTMLARPSVTRDDAYFLLGYVTHKQSTQADPSYDGDVVVRKLRYAKTVVQMPEDAGPGPIVQ